jgi:zinc transport system substrate-binding protein
MRSMTYGKSSSSLKVVASFYPLAYIAEKIAGNKAQIVSLIQPGLEVHSWQPSTYNLVDASEAQVILYNGAGLDNWMEDDLLPAIDITGIIIVDTTSEANLIVNVEKTEIQEHGLYDPHTWMSPDTIIQQAKSIYDALIKTDSINSDYYTEKWTSLRSRLIELDNLYMQTLEARKRNIIFATHDAFGYLARRYGFEQHGVIGLSADEQPSTQTFAEIVDLMQTSDTYVFYLEPGYSDIYLQTIKTELTSKTGREIKILKLYHMNGPQDGLDYLEQMEANLVSLAEGLGT